MTRKRFLSCVFFLIMVLFYDCSSNPANVIVLGDLHYDLPEDHDMTWLTNKPDDVRQIKEYTSYTSKYWVSFMDVLKRKALSKEAPASLLIQLGDLSEGLAGSPEKAMQMASHAMEAVEKANMPVPWIIVKGNHDVTGPGAKEAFSEFYLPEIRKQTGDKKIISANYSYRSGNVQVTCVDPRDNSVDIVNFLEKELSESKAAVKIVALHDPVIPVTERCWHLYRTEPDKREKLLEVIAKNRAIVLCAHLHRYSVVRRNTEAGPVVQIMTVSVVTDSSYIKPARLITQYGPALVDSVPSWDPPTAQIRKEWLAEESRYVTYYKQTDLPGYSLLRINQNGKSIVLEYYAAFGKKPYDVVNISELMK